MFFWYDSLPLTLLYVIFFFMGAMNSGVAPIAYASTKELFSEESAGTSIGTVNLFPFLGGVVAQPFIGFVLDKAGKVAAHYPPSAYRSVIMFCAFASILGIIATLFMKETFKK